MDLADVKSQAKWALDHARSGKGPAILHIKTYRYRGHSMSDPAKYRSKEEVDGVKTNSDCIDRVRQALLILDSKAEPELEQIDKKVKELVLKAVTFAQESPEPDASELYTDVVI